MDKDNGEEKIKYGRWGWVWKGRVIGVNGENCNWTTIKENLLLLSSLILPVVNESIEKK